MTITVETTDWNTRAYTYKTETVELDPPVALDHAYRLAAQAIGAMNFDQLIYTNGYASFEKGREPWRWFSQHDPDARRRANHCRRMGLLASIRECADNLTSQEQNDALGILLGSDDVARAYMADTWSEPNGTAAEYLAAARHVEAFWPTISAVAELIYTTGYIPAGYLERVELPSAFPDSTLIRINDPGSYVIGDGWIIDREKGEAILRRKQEEEALRSEMEEAANA